MDGAIAVKILQVTHSKQIKNKVHTNFKFNITLEYIEHLF